MFALVGQVERPFLGSRGVPGDRPGRDARRAGEVGRPAGDRRRAAGRRRTSGSRGPGWAPRTGPPVVVGGPARRGRGARRAGDVARSRGARHVRGAARGHRPAGVRAATGHPGRRRRPPRPDVHRAAQVRRAAPRPGHRRLASRRRHLERPSAVPGDGRARRSAVRPCPPGGRRRDARHRLSPERGDLVRLHDPAGRDALGPRRRRARAERGPAGRRHRHRRRRAGLPARRERAAARRCGPRRRASGDPRCEQRRRPRDLGGRDHRRRRRLGRAGRPSGSDDRDPAPGAPRRGDPDHRCRELRGLGRPGLPLPPPRDVPRTHVGGDGVRAAGRDHGRAHPPRPTGRRPRRRRRPGDDDGRARDRGPRARSCRSSSSSTTNGTEPSGCGRNERGTGQGVATELGPVDFAAIARACGARGARVETDAEFEPALRTALAADRPTVIQVALDRRWVSVDQRPA